jgi:eukaryotic-like serine/threonine-protein kinase
MKKIGRYDVIEELGRGATGVVYRGFDPTIGRVVAIKVVSLEGPTEEGIPGAREVFMQEARAAGRLSHPNIVAIHDALDDPQTRTCCIVMEYVSGRTLENVFNLGPPLETDRVLKIIRQVAEALDYAHRQNVIHRDLKPANILLADDGAAKLTDFGIAKIMSREGARRTLNLVMGTPSYMSPEQVTGGGVDARSDLFSLGVIFYTMLTGQKPFRGDTAAVMFKIVYEDPIMPSQLNPRVGSAHDYLVLRCLAKDREKRYPSARRFLDDLDDVQQGRPPRSEAHFPVSDLRVGEPTVIKRRPAFVFPAVARLAVGRKNLVWLSAGVSGGLALLALWAGLWVSHRRHAARPPAAGVQLNPALPGGTSAASPASSAPAATHSASAPAPSREGAKLSAASESEGQPSLPRSNESSAKAGLKVRPRGTRKEGQPAKTASAEMKAGASTASRISNPTPASVFSSGGNTKTATAKRVQLVCTHDLENATLMVSSGNQVISQWALKGRKKRGFLGVKGSYTGTLSRPFTVPAAAGELSVRVVSREGSVDLTRTISAASPAASAATLRVVVNGSRLKVDWEQSSPPKP